MNQLYSRTQIGYVTGLALTTAVVILAVGLVRGFTWIGLAVLIILIGADLCFCCMTIRVNREFLVWSFGPGLIRKKVAIAQIDQVRRVRNHWLYGWGIRITPHGWLYNVSGLDAVEVHLRSGKVFRLGTDQPDRLIEAINQAMAMR